MNLNTAAKRALECANKRGKVKENTDFENWCKDISSEVVELSCCGNPAVQQAKDELADVIINCLSMAAYYKIDIEQAIANKMAFNESRED